MHTGGGRALWLLFLVAGCTGNAGDKGARAPSVIVLVMDGVRTDEFTSTTVSSVTGVTGEAYAKNAWKTLAPDASVVRAAHNTGITITAPAHLALVSGRVDAFANFPVDDVAGPGLYRPLLPTLFEEARSQLDLPEEEVLLLANTELLEPVEHSLYPDAGEGAETWELFDPETGVPLGEDAPVIAALLERIDATPPRLAVVNLHDVDRAGHYGHGDAYAEGVTAVDEQVAAFWEAVQKKHPAYAESLLLVVVSDHGRHDHDEDQGWHNHGDACTGCREVPLMVIGGGAVADVILDETVAAIDLAPAIAAHLGVTMPWAEGLPDTALFPEATTTPREGDVSRVGSAIVALQRWLDDPEQRSEVRVGEEIVSTAGVFAAEAPALVEGADGARVCFRELAWDAVDGAYPWVARCLAGSPTEGWAEMGFPDPEVAPFFRAALAERDGTTWAAWPYNPRGAGEAGTGGRIGLSLAGWTPEGGWTEAVNSQGIFPTDAAIVATDLGLVVAYGASMGDPDSRYTRHVRVVPVPLTEGVPVMEELTSFSLVELLGEGARVEHPALAAEGSRVRVAMLGLTEAGGTVAAATSADAGRTWSSPVALPDGGTPLPHLAPAWDGAEVVWGVLVDGAAHLCRATPGDADAACVDVGSARLQSFVAADGAATVVRDAGVGSWETATLAW
jgi:hypothetical protein